MFGICFYQSLCLYLVSTVNLVPVILNAATAICEASLERAQDWFFPQVIWKYSTLVPVAVSLVQMKICGIAKKPDMQMSLHAECQIVQ